MKSKLKFKINPKKIQWKYNGFAYKMSINRDTHLEFEACIYASYEKDGSWDIEIYTPTGDTYEYAPSLEKAKKIVIDELELEYLRHFKNLMKVI